MSCVNPPLVAKPSRGYGWTCAPCSRRHEDKVDAVPDSGLQTRSSTGAGGSTTDQAQARDTTPKAGATGLAAAFNGVASASSASASVSGSALGVPPGKVTRGRGRPRKERPSNVVSVNEEELQVKHYKMWPFRYFGFVVDQVELR